MRYLDLREFAELILGTLLGLGFVWVVHRQSPGLFRGGISYRDWLGIGAGAGFLLAVIWSARKVDQRIDHRLPPHQRSTPSFRDGRPVGVLAWRTRDAAQEYLWFVLGVVVVLLVIWLARTFVPGRF